MKNKKPIFAILILGICIIFLIFLVIVIINNNSGMTEKQIVNRMTEMGDAIYAEYYYPDLVKYKNEEEIKEFLKQFEKIGLKFSLTELEKYSEDFKRDISKFKSKEKTCDKDNTMIIIYPSDPYTSTSYSTEIKLDCGFKK